MISTPSGARSSILVCAQEHVTADRDGTVSTSCGMIPDPSQRCCSLLSYSDVPLHALDASHDLGAESRYLMELICNAYCSLSEHMLRSSDVSVANVEHVLKTNFDNYEKGERFRLVFEDLLGDGQYAPSLSCMLPARSERHCLRCWYRGQVSSMWTVKPGVPSARWHLTCLRSEYVLCNWMKDSPSVCPAYRTFACV